MYPHTPASLYQTRLLGAGMLWLLGGGALLLSTLVPLHTEWLGWTPTFWLVGAPLVILLALNPRWPRQLLALALRRPRRRVPCSVVWH